jgi:hypothetical protein
MASIIGKTGHITGSKSYMMENVILDDKMLTSIEKYNKEQVESTKDCVKKECLKFDAKLQDMMKLLTKYNTDPKPSISMWKAILGPHLTKHKTVLTREELATILRWKTLPGTKAMPTRKEDICKQIILDYNFPVGI